MRSQNIKRVLTLVAEALGRSFNITRAWGAWGMSLPFAQSASLALLSLLCCFNRFSWLLYLVALSGLLMES